MDQNQIIKFFGKSKYPLRITIGTKGDPSFIMEDSFRIFRRDFHGSIAGFPLTKKMISEKELFTLYERFMDDGTFKNWFYQNVLPDIRKCKRLKGMVVSRMEPQRQDIITKEYTHNPLKIPFSLFASGNYNDKALDQPQFKLYIVRKSNTVCYIGISTRNVWNRWFDGSQSHIQFNIYGEMFGNSTIGREVSINKELFTIELWTIPDCLSFLGLNVKNKTPYTIHEIEPLMIRKLKPIYNVIYNTK